MTHRVHALGALRSRDRWSKEFMQMRRDRLTFAMMVGVPMMQLVLFGYAINTDPKHLPTAVVRRRQQRRSRARFVGGAARTPATSRDRRRGRSEAEGGGAARRRRRRSSLVDIPHGFRAHAGARRAAGAAASRRTPPIPPATGNAHRGARQRCARPRFDHDLHGPLARLQPGAARSSFASIAATTPRASRSTTSCRG